MTTIQDTTFDMSDHLSGIGAHLAGPANVIMQLSWPGVGYGVMQSKVESGRIDRHPLKRARTTFTYLAVSLLGDERDRTAFRSAVNRQHAQVRSEPGAEVTYNAFDPRLQLWVAACLYYGSVDLLEKLRGPLDEATADALYTHCRRLGTTLQVTEDMWPPDREAFATYWEESLAQVSIDEPMREYLTGLMTFSYLHPRVRRMLAPTFHEFVTRGFLPPPFRAAMHLSWDERDQQRFDRLMRRVGRMDQALPPSLRAFPFNVLLRDMRRRVRRNRPLV